MDRKYKLGIGTNFYNTFLSLRQIHLPTHLFELKNYMRNNNQYHDVNALGKVILYC